MEGRVEEASPGRPSDDGDRGNGHLRRRLPPSLGLLPLEPLSEDRLLHRDALAVLHLLPGADDGQRWRATIPPVFETAELGRRVDKKEFETEVEIVLAKFWLHID